MCLLRLLLRKKSIIQPLLLVECQRFTMKGMLSCDDHQRPSLVIPGNVAWTAGSRQRANQLTALFAACASTPASMEYQNVGSRHLRAPCTHAYLHPTALV
jgi:hypothetical protein